MVPGALDRTAGPGSPDGLVEVRHSLSKVKARTFQSLLAATLIAVAAPTAADTADEDRPRIGSLAAWRQDGRVRVSFRVENGLSDELLERVHSGIAVSFVHRIEIVTKRSVPLWFPKEWAHTRVETSVEYDPLTKQYTLRRSVRVKARRKKDAPAPIEEQRTTESLDDVRSWMTELRELEVYDPVRPLPERDLRVRVESILGRRYLMLIFPATIGASAEYGLS